MILKKYLLFIEVSFFNQSSHLATGKPVLIGPADIESSVVDGMMFSVLDECVQKVPILVNDAAKGNILQMLDALDEGVPVDFENALGTTALISAINANQAESVRLLLARNADPNLLNRRGESPLFSAVVSGNVEVVRLLLSAPTVDPNLGMSEGSVTPLMQAAIDGNADIVSALLEGGADPRLQDAVGLTAATKVFFLEDESSESKEAKKTTLRLLFSHRYLGEDATLPPVHVAVSTGNIDLLRTYIGAGMDPTEAVPGGATPLMAASKAKLTDVVEVLLTHPRVLETLDLQDDQGMTALMQAIDVANDVDDDSTLSVAREKLTKTLISAKSSLDIQSNKGLSALMLAVEGDSREVVRLLIDAGADPTEAGPSGATPLMAASKAKLTEVVNVLLTHPRVLETLDVQDDQGKTALMRAIEAANDWDDNITPREDITKALISAKSSLDIQNNVGLSALMLAVDWEHKEVVKLLIDAKADLNLRDIAGNSALSYALIRHDPFLYEDETAEIFPLLISLGADLNRKNNNGFTALMLASEIGCDELVSVMIDGGANMDTQNDDGDSALMMAIRQREVSTARLLLCRGADVHLENVNDETAASLAFDIGNGELLQTIQRAQRRFRVAG